MNARISREFAFQAAIHYDNSFLLNTYLLDVMMDVTTEDIREQNIALERIKYLLEVQFENCVFIDHKETKSLDLYAKAGIKVCLLPEEPYDQVIALILLNKFNAVTESKLFVNEIRIRSKICDDVSFYVSVDDSIEFSEQNNAWWNENSPSICGSVKKSKKEKIVELKKEPIDWASIGLSWKDPTEKLKDKGEIVFIPVDK